MTLRVTATGMLTANPQMRTTGTARHDFESAESCFAAMANQIRQANNGGPPA